MDLSEMNEGIKREEKCNKDNENDLRTKEFENKYYRRA